MSAVGRAEAASERSVHPDHFSAVLGAELRRLRDAASRTQSDVGAAIGPTYATLVNWERGKTKISKSDLVYLLAELLAPLYVRKELEQLREESDHGAGQWVVYSSARPVSAVRELLRRTRSRRPASSR